MSYTRREYVKSSPPTGIAKFTMGTPSQDYSCSVALISEEKKLINGRALESARIASNKIMADKYGEIGYLLSVRVYPHEIVRSHRMMGFAGADRMSQGMKRAFGKPTARGAHVDPGQAVIVIETNQDKVDDAKASLKRASLKLPFASRIEVR